MMYTIYIEVYGAHTDSIYGLLKQNRMPLFVSLISMRRVQTAHAGLRKHSGHY
jgi:hypothetical protein